MRDNDKEKAELVQTLIRATRDFVALSIQNESNKIAYLAAMYECDDVCYAAHDAPTMKLGLMALMYYAPTRRVEWSSDIGKYYKLAIEHSLDIVDSISKRFDGSFYHEV